MPVHVERFLGRDLTIPEDRSYCVGEGLWVQETADGRLAAGLTEPALLLSGGIRETEALVEDGAEVEAGQTVCLALTAKLKYIASPLTGRVTFAAAGHELGQDPYGTPIFFIHPSDEDRAGLTDAVGYAKALAHSEGTHNPEGAKGGISSTCKAVYGGLREQKLRD